MFRKRKRTGVPLLDEQQELAARRAKSIALWLLRVDPLRQPAMILATIGSSLLAGAYVADLVHSDAPSTLLALLTMLPMLVFILWVNQRNQQLLPAFLGYPGLAWDDAVKLDLDRLLRANSAPPVAPKRPPIGFR